MSTIRMNFDIPTEIVFHKKRGHKSYYFIKDASNEKGKKFICIHDTPGTNLIETKITEGKNKKLDIKMLPSQSNENHDRERVEIKINQAGNNTAIKFGETKYFAYTMMIHPDSELPDNQTILTQIK